MADHRAEQKEKEGFDKKTSSSSKLDALALDELAVLVKDILGLKREQVAVVHGHVRVRLVLVLDLERLSVRRDRDRCDVSVPA